MKLYLVQHAEAKREEEDPERSLSEKGWGDIRKVATFVNQQMNVTVSSIMHSGKRRAQQTAEILAEYLHPAHGIKQTEGLEPLADPSVWIDRISQTKKDIMLVGHLPHLSKLAAYLLWGDETKQVIDFHQGGIVCLTQEESGAWLVHWMLIPEAIKSG